ncbi:hydrolase CocE/NonD family protein [Segniliparus rotundus DSM 44985]|uniref:Hydrolase CocE/NonD family protein n=1 Tax=Segniliparus rotundus (strain ATCC BAA-972 / CDC 1076 / CIP 108378 / DSM 44985 / JCM 13578) TaxID=640132 RepID=D6ZAB8_SEGRD|nr:CocE/NonD family hydrolase [Segniliparus rotundus]ADG96660.1 hydrolase CocE/NonD family protein [Segniliparus rotundus DSM 44985]
MDNGFARCFARWLGTGFASAGLTAAAWLTASAAASADETAASSEGAGAFAPIAPLRDSGLIASNARVAAEADDEANLAAEAPDDADDEASAQDVDVDEREAADANDPKYPDQFTLGDLENQWSDTWENDLQYTNIGIDWDVPITMSDGTVLKANVYRPLNDDGTPVDEQLPVIVNITPYTKLASMAIDSIMIPHYGENWVNFFGDMYMPPGLKGLEQLLQGFNSGFFQELGVDRRLLQSGYAQVVVDQRGTGFSQGTWQVLGKREQLDDKEVVEWASEQPWSNGKVGMTGVSYSAINQLQAAQQHPKGLKALFPVVPSADLVADVVAPGGGVGVGFLPYWLSLINFMKVLPDLSASAGGTYDWQWADDRRKEVFVKLDLLAQALNTPDIDKVAEYYLDSLDEDSPILQEVQRRQAQGQSMGQILVAIARTGSPWRDKALSEGDPHRIPLDVANFADETSPWRKDLITDVSKVDVPTFVVGGWHDLFVNSEVRLLNELPLPPSEKKVLIGDWYHFTTGSGLGKYPNPPRMDVLARAWFDHWLKGIDNGIDTFAPATFFSQSGGSGVWTNADEWPRKGMEYQKLYLSGQQAMSTAFSMLDGSLAEQPDEDENGHWISFGLTNMCSRDMNQPFLGFMAWIDACHIDSRIAELNGLTFTSAPVEEQTVISGPIAVHLNTVQQNKDGYWDVTVNDVDEFGQSTVLSTGQLVVSLRGLNESKTTRLPDGTVVDPYPVLDFANWRPVEPGDPTPIDVGVVPTDATLEPGHRLRVDVFASNFPKSIPIWPLMDDMRLAPQLLELDPDSPSWVVLPVNRNIPGVS